MTILDLQRIERELSIGLPADYKSLMMAYPFAPDSFSADCLLPNSADRLLEIAKGRPKLPPHSFIIGDDSDDETYFLDVSRVHSPVFVFAVSSGEVSEQFPDLGAYVEHCKKTDAELRQYAKRVENRKWWQFWIPKI
jgi:hypothetical protein